MDNCRLLELLGQAEASTTGEVFREFLRGGVSLMLAAEVSELCGAKYHPSDEAACQRAGSAPGRVLWEGRSEAVQRPRVRRRNDDGSTQEVLLQTYQAAKQPDQLHSAILRALIAGVSGREMHAVHPESYDPANRRRRKSCRYQQLRFRLLQH
jgi:transposase-like protein